MHIHYIIENLVKFSKPSCMHPHHCYHKAEVCKSPVTLFLSFLTMYLVSIPDSLESGLRSTRGAHLAGSDDVACKIVQNHFHGGLKMQQ